MAYIGYRCVGCTMSIVLSVDGHNLHNSLWCAMATDGWDLHRISFDACYDRDASFFF